MRQNKVQILSQWIDNLSMHDVLMEIPAIIDNRIPKAIFTPNVNFLVRAEKDDKFSKVLSESDFLVPDGKPLIWASRFLGTPLKEKVSGSSLFFELCKLAVEHGYTIFLLGAAPGVARMAKHKLEANFKGLQISGTYSPPYGFENNPSEIENINSILRNSKTDILVVGLGSPKQEYFIHENKSKYQIPLSLGLGASIDFAAGIKVVPPNILKNIGLAWLWRLIEEPRRLAGRYLVVDPSFFKLIWNQKLQKK